MHTERHTLKHICIQRDIHTERHRHPEKEKQSYIVKHIRKRKTNIVY